MTREEFKLLENVAAVAACVHADDRLGERIEKTEESFMDRLRWCVEAGEALTEKEPADYEEADLDWYDVTDAVADGFYDELGPDKAVELALNPPPPPTPEEKAKMLADAAPELLATCVALTTSDKNGRFGTPSFDEAVRQARAAIEKAEGR